MRQSILQVCLVLCLSVKPAVFASSFANGGRLEGTILREGQREPISGARVELIASSGGTPDEYSGLNIVRSTDYEKPRWAAVPVEEGVFTQAKRAPVAFVISGFDGRFVFSGVSPGTYRLAVQAHGYVGREHGQRFSGGWGKPIVVGSGAPLQDIEVRLTPTGSIEGQLRDLGGEPLSGVPVRLCRYVHGRDGVRGIGIAAAALTDDRGFYRIFWIEPGRYFLAAGGPVEHKYGEEDEYQSRAVSYYPGSPDESLAAPIDIRPGSEQVFDWALPLRESFEMRILLNGVPRVGSLDDAADIAVEVQGVEGEFHEVENVEVRFDDANGTIAVVDLVPGIYRFAVRIEESESSSLPVASGGDTERLLVPSIRRFVAITSPVGSATGGTSMMDAFPAERLPDPVTARIVADSAGEAIENVSVFLLSEEEPREYSIGSNEAVEIPFLVSPGFDDSSIVSGRKYRVFVTDLPESWHVRSAAVDGVDAIGAAAPFNPGGKLEIVLARAFGQVEGFAFNADGTVAESALAVLVPDLSRHRADLYAAVLVDESGHFRFSGIAAGDYTVYAWEGIEPYGYFDPEILARFGGLPARVHVGDAAIEMVNVRLEPSPGPFIEAR